MSQGHAKQIVYRYNGHISSEEIRYDHRGIINHRKGEILTRHGGAVWKVESIEDVGRKDGLDHTFLVCLVEMPASVQGEE